MYRTYCLRFWIYRVFGLEVVGLGLSGLYRFGRVDDRLQPAAGCHYLEP